MEEGLESLLGTQPKVFTTEDTGDHRENYGIGYAVGMAAPTPIRDLRINEITGRIISAAMRVHSLLGPGLLESAYQARLQHELTKRGLNIAGQVGLLVVL